jgi:hypothetical protein
MGINRISRQQRQAPAPQPVAVMASQAFIVCPGFVGPSVGAPGWSWRDWIFHIAYQAAQANNAAASRRYEEWLFSCWN